MRGGGWVSDCVLCDQSCMIGVCHEVGGEGEREGSSFFVSKQRMTFKNRERGRG